MKRAAQTTSIVCGVLLFVATGTTPSFACQNLGEICGSVTVANIDCKHGNEDRVAVHIYKVLDKVVNPDCTNEWNTINIGSSVTVGLKGATTDEWNFIEPCYYKIEAQGVMLGKETINGQQVSYVTCKKDWVGVCQCTKD